MLSEAPIPGMRQASDQELTSPCMGLRSPPNTGRQLVARLCDPLKNPKRMRLALRQAAPSSAQTELPRVPR